MDQERWRRVDSLFQDALLLDPAVRLEVLREWCADDLELFDEVQAMLFYDKHHTSFLKESARDRAIELIAKSEERRLPEIMGGYRVEKLIAHGGMGSVYIAKQLEPVERIVAVKVLNSRERNFLQRFDYERQVLALLKHPHVAQVYDAGLTVEGYHYFTMEYVQGEDLLSYCDDQHLSLEARLNLFVLACDGVSHAHRRGVIHRDLKPSNILVNTDEEKPIPKIIDFGIAQKVTESTMTNPSASGFGTPAYMSPECFQGDQADTTADIYALGVVLYQLLCGRLPFDDEIYKDRQSLFEILETQVLPLPSHNVYGPSLEEAANRRQVSPQRLIGRLRGDLDAIVAKCMQHNPKERYHSVDALVDDVKRYLSGRTVSAHSSSYFYSLKKAVTRDMRMTLAVSSLLIAFVLLLVGLYYQNKSEDAQKRRNAMTEIVGELLKSTNPKSDRRNSAVSIIGVAEKLADTKVENEQDKVDMLISLGESLAAWGNNNDAIEKFDKAIKIAKSNSTMVERWYKARLERAYSLLKISPEVAIDELCDLRPWAESEGANSLVSMRVRRALADALKNANQTSEAIEEYENFFHDFPDNAPDRLAGKINYANLLIETDPYKAYGLYCEVLDERGASDSAETDTLYAIHGIGWALINLEEYEVAEPYVVNAYQNRYENLGENQDSLSSFHNYIRVQRNLGKFCGDEVVSCYLEIYDRKFNLSGYHKSLLPTANNLADAYNNVREYDRAYKLLKKVRSQYNDSDIAPILRDTLDITELESLVGAKRFEQSIPLAQALNSRKLRSNHRKALEKCWETLHSKFPNLGNLH